MTTPQEKVVLEFLAAFRDHWPTALDATMALLAEDATYQIVVPTSPPIVGRAAIHAEIARMMKRTPQARQEMRSFGSGGNTVFAERVDYNFSKGVRWIPTSLVGVFEVNAAGLISAWREYMDLTAVAREYNAPVEAIVKSLLPKTA